MSTISEMLGLDNTPTNQQVRLDPTTQGLINAQITQASRPVSQFQNEMEKGVSQNVNRLSGSSQNDYGKSGVTEGYKDALRNAYSGQTGDALRSMSISNEINAEKRKANALGIASSLALHQQQTNTNYYQTLTDAYSQMEAQRAAFVAALSGVGQMAIGQYAAASNRKVSPHDSPDMSMQMNKNPSSFVGSGIPEIEPTNINTGHYYGNTYPKGYYPMESY